ncbi:hypothetical protein AC1031_003479, partial [Aphanomyces cochlioides]
LSMLTHFCICTSDSNKLMDYDDLIQQPVVKIAAALDPRTKDFADDRDTLENCLVIEWETTRDMSTTLTLAHFPPAAIHLLIRAMISWQH